MSNLGNITFTIDGNGATLTVTGPAVPVGPATVHPTVGVRRDPAGSYHFVVGHNESVIAPAQLPAQLRSALDSLAGGRGGGARTTIRMPGLAELLKSGRGGASASEFISYAEYNNLRVSRLITPGQAVWWPMMTQGEYNSLISLYRLLLPRPGSASR